MPDKPPHPNQNPQYSKADYIRNSVFAIAKVNLALYLGEGANLHEAALLAGDLQQAIKIAYHSAVTEAGFNITNQPPPESKDEFSEGNPFI